MKRATIDVIARALDELARKQPGRQAFVFSLDGDDAIVVLGPSRESRRLAMVDKRRAA